jgi:hypothetical protein
VVWMGVLTSGLSLMITLLIWYLSGSSSEAIIGCLIGSLFILLHFCFLGDR